MREVERCLQDKKEQANNNRERLVCLHANIFKNSTKCKQLEDKFNTIVHD